MLQFSNKREKCPKCEANRGLAVFVGMEQTGFGYCHSCGYKNIPHTADRLDRKSEPPTKYVDELLFQQSQSEGRRKCVLTHELIALGIPLAHIHKMHVGTARSGKTLFFYRNRHGQIINVKAMQYKPDLHRDKAIAPQFLFRKSQGYGQCLFGEWQLQNSDKTVCLVESEKTVLLGSYIKPEYIWIGTGGANGLTFAKSHVLAGRKVLIAFDADEAGRRNAIAAKKMLSQQGATVDIRDLFPDRNDGFDFADYAIEKLKKLKSDIEALPEIAREDFEERAAILEFDAGLPRYEAEIKAYRIK